MPNYYPPTGYHFKVRFEGFGPSIPDTGFQSVSGMKATVNAKTFKEGGENRFSHRLPEPVTYGTLDMKRGLLTGSELINWFRDAQEGFKFETHDITVLLLNDQAQPILGWNFVQAWPSEWGFDDLNSTDSKVYAESLKFNYQYYTRITSGLSGQQ